MSSTGIEAAADAPQRGNEIGESFEREVFAIERDQDRIGGDEGVQREQAERRWRIDEHVVEAIAEAADDRAQPLLAIRHRHEFDFRAGEIAVGGNQTEPGDRGLQDVRLRRGLVPRQGVIDGASRGGLPFEADAARQIGLGIEVDQEHALASQGQGRRQVDRRSGLPDPTFLIRDDEHPSHSVIRPKLLFRTSQADRQGYRCRGLGSTSLRHSGAHFFRLQRFTASLAPRFGGARVLENATARTRERLPS